MTPTPADLGFAPERLDRIGPYLDRYVESGLVPAVHVVVSRHGETAFEHRSGVLSIEHAGPPVTDDSIWRLFSMTKPITTVAALRMVERAELRMTDEVASFIPAFADTRVYVSGGPRSMVTEGLQRPVTVHDLLTHTSGLTYDFLDRHPIDAVYRRSHLLDVTAEEGLAVVCDRLAAVPLQFQPGTCWNYSVSTDVLGRVLEVVADRPLDDVLRREVFEPLDMTETGFAVPDADRDRLVGLYGTTAAELPAMPLPDFEFARPEGPTFFAGGGGLFGTMGDYRRFVEMLRRRGELDGTRVLGSRTVDLMMSNHLPGGADIASFGIPVGAAIDMQGVGFGLGGSVVIDPPRAARIVSRGEYSWGGMASTAFWVDPVEDITCVFMTQLAPSSMYPFRPDLRTIVNASLVD